MLTADEARKTWRYDAETGELYWRKPKQGRRLGVPAGNVNGQGYRHIHLKGRYYRVHRLVWLYVYGVWPAQFIDHVDGNRLNNRIDNLRDASNAENLRNTGPSKNSTSGVKGVSWCKKDCKWRARITVDGKTHRLGRFDRLEDAAAAYKAAAGKFHGAFANCG